MYPLIQYMQAREKAVPYAMGIICCQTKVKLWKLNRIMMRMNSRESPTVQATSFLMVVELEALP